MVPQQQAFYMLGSTNQGNSGNINHTGGILTTGSGPSYLQRHVYLSLWGGSGQYKDAIEAFDQAIKLQNVHII